LSVTLLFDLDKNLKNNTSLLRDKTRKDKH